jgi:TetR/AcrR family transcriptional regulator, tetracycline repressor protein
VTGRTRKPTASAPRTGLDRSTVLEAALQIVDASGVDALTMRALAQELNVYPNALYSYVDSRAHLIGEVASGVIRTMVLPDPHAYEWDQWLVACAHRWRDKMHEHPNIAAVTGTMLGTTTRALPVVERILSSLTEGGFSGAQLVSAYNAYVGCLIGWVSVELSHEPNSSNAAWKTDFADALDSLDPNTFPTLARAMPLMRNAAFMTRWDSGEIRPLDDAFATAVEVLIRGLKHLASAR